MAQITKAQQEQALRLKGFLRREKYIRYSGILLTISPFGNFLWSAALSGVPRWYDPHILFAITRSIPAVLYFLWATAFAAGLQMLKGKRSSWTFTLCILGMNVVFGIVSFKRDITLGWAQPTMSLAINMSLFALIYTQEFHQRLERKLWAARMNRPFSLEIKTNIKVCFDGKGAWARITEITHTGMRVRSLDGTAPHQIEYRMIELGLTQGLTLRAKFSARIGSDYIFRYVGMNPSSLSALHKWAHRVAGRPADPGPDFNSAVA